MPLGSPNFDLKNRFLVGCVLGGKFFDVAWGNVMWRAVVWWDKLIFFSKGNKKSQIF
jgi:hypothetical protein